MTYFARFNKSGKTTLFPVERARFTQSVLYKLAINGRSDGVNFDSLVIIAARILQWRHEYFCLFGMLHVMTALASHGHRPTRKVPKPNPNGLASR